MFNMYLKFLLFCQLLKESEKTRDQFRLQRNCPPTPPITQHFVPSETQMLTLSDGRGSWVDSQKPKLIQNNFTGSSC